MVEHLVAKKANKESEYESHGHRCVEAECSPSGFSNIHTQLSWSCLPPGSVWYLPAAQLYQLHVTNKDSSPLLSECDVAEPAVQTRCWQRENKKKERWLRVYLQDMMNYPCIHVLFYMSNLYL